MKVECSPGYDGGLRQQFFLELYGSAAARSGGTRIANYSGHIPQFSITGLEPAQRYLLEIYAKNAKGRSKEALITAFTLAMPESMNRLAKGKTTGNGGDIWR